MIPYDELAQRDAENEARVWISDKLIPMIDPLISFIASRRPGKPAGEYVGFTKGSFNIGIIVGFDDESRNVIVRFPMPGVTAANTNVEKIRNELSFIEYLRENTTIPLPRVESSESMLNLPEDIQSLGPFLILGFVEGTALDDLLGSSLESRERRTESKKDDFILASDIDEAKLDYVYEQIADYLLQMSRLKFDTIGALSRGLPRVEKEVSSPGTTPNNPQPSKNGESLHGSSDKWQANEPPLLYNWNTSVTCVQAYEDTRPTLPFTSTKEYLYYLADEHIHHLQVQRNLGYSEAQVKRRYIARNRFNKLIDRYCTHDAPFLPFIDDMRPGNMLADPETWRITCVLDFEFANIMPAPFSFGPPWWLVLLSPAAWLENYSMQEFLERYEPRLEQFLRAMERVEEREISLGGENKIRLSERMRNSWDMKTFWFNYGIRRSLDVDAVYWEALYEPSRDIEFALTEAEEVELEKLVHFKLEQSQEYAIEWQAWELKRSELEREEREQEKGHSDQPHG